MLLLLRSAGSMYCIVDGHSRSIRSNGDFFVIIFVLYLWKLCFLSKQRCHSISVHNVFYDMFGFYEFNRLCSVYSVCGQSRGYFIASVWDVFRDLAFWLLYWLYCFVFSVCLSVCLYTLLCE